MTCTPSRPCRRADCEWCADPMDASRNGHYRFADLVADAAAEAPDPEPSTWQAVDLTAALAGADIPPPEYLLRSDEVPLLYAGRVHWLQGESESLKSWAAQLGATQVLLDGGSVLYVDFEDDDRGVVARFRSLGVPTGLLNDSDRFRYLRPDEALYDRHGTAHRGVVDLAEHLEHRWQLAIIDGVTEAMTTEGLKILDNTDIALWNRMLPRRIAGAGAAVACIDHVPKARDNQGRYAIGGQHKLAGVSGAVYRFTATKPFGRALGSEPTTGTATMTIEKDRPGWVRGRIAGPSVAVLEITAYPDGGVTARLLPPDVASTAPPWPLLEAILGYVAAYEGSSQAGIEKGVTGHGSAVRGAARWLVETGWLRVEPVGQAYRHYLTDVGREQLEDGTR